jgi:oligoribonuclease NrnB/cAMP/cGMP phosphodiesterase (DHH superfamily)
MYQMLRPTDIKETILVTHRNCMDGAGCAIMFLQAGGKRENIRYVAAGQVERFMKNDPVFKTDKFLIFADLGLNQKTAFDTKHAEEMEKRGNCVILDHHESSLYLETRPWCRIDMNACGTELLRRYLVFYGFMKENTPDAFMKLSNLIDDFDRGFFRDSRALAMADLFTFVGQQRFIDRFKSPWARFIDENFWGPDELEILDIIRDRRLEATEFAVKRVVKRELLVPEYFSFPLKGAFLVSSEPYINHILMRILDENTDCQFAAQINFDKGSVSLRSRGDINVREIAQLFGGAGHRAASGHPIPKDTVSEILEFMYPIIQEDSE